MHIDYHVAIDGHYYSVPYTLIKKEVEVRITSNTIECFYRGNRSASHRRSDQKGRHTTIAVHMPTCPNPIARPASGHRSA